MHEFSILLCGCHCKSMLVSASNKYILNLLVDISLFLISLLDNSLPYFIRLQHIINFPFLKIFLLKNHLWEEIEKYF